MPPGQPAPPAPTAVLRQGTSRPAPIATSPTRSTTPIMQLRDVVTALPIGSRGTSIRPGLRGGQMFPHGRIRHQDTHSSSTSPIRAISELQAVSLVVSIRCSRYDRAGVVSGRVGGNVALHPSVPRGVGQRNRFARRWRHPRDCCGSGSRGLAWHRPHRTPRAEQPLARNGRASESRPLCGAGRRGWRDDGTWRW